MEQTKPTIAKNSMNYGAITGLGVIILSILFYVTGNGMSEWQNWIGYAIVIAGIIAGTQKYRDNVMSGYMSYSQCLGSGVLISLFAGILSGFYTYVFFEFIDPDMIESLLEKIEVQMSEKGTPDESIEIGMQYTRKFMTPFWMTFWVIMAYTFWGFIFSLITSAFLKKNNELMS